MIRFARKEDAAEIAPLILVILKDMELPLLDEHSEREVLDILEEAIADPDYRYGYKRGLVYEQEGKVAGIAFGYPEEDEPIIDKPLRNVMKNHGLNENTQLFIDPETFENEWYLDSISVNEKYRGLGIGSKLLNALPQLAMKENKKIIGLNVDKANKEAKKLYLRQGFKDVDEIIISDHTYDHMQKPVD